MILRLPLTSRRNLKNKKWIYAYVIGLVTLIVLGTSIGLYFALKPDDTPSNPSPSNV